MSTTSAAIIAGLVIIFAFWFWHGYRFGSDLAHRAEREAFQIQTRDE